MNRRRAMDFMSHSGRDGLSLSQRRRRQKASDAARPFRPKMLHTTLPAAPNRRQLPTRHRDHRTNAWDGREDDMSTRRDFITGASAAMASAVFVGCDFLDAKHAHAQGAPRRREVVVNGKRVKTVDIHAHVAFPQAMTLMGLKPPTPGSLVMSDDRIRAMDEQGIDIEALSINPFWYRADR